jgi:tetratricopeptide (TPR) repeat protein
MLPATRMFCGFNGLRSLLSVCLSGFLLVSMSGVLPAQPKLQQQAQKAQDSEQFAEAEKLWQQVLRQHPTDSNAYYNLGVSLHRQFKFSAAIAAYRQATRLNARDSAAYINLGLALIQTNQLEEAIVAYQSVIQLPDQSSTPANSHTLAHYNLAIIYSRQDKIAEARQEILAALAQTPNFAPAQELLQGMK